MRIGVFVPLATPYATPDFIGAAGPAVEERGFDSMWVAEHVVLFDDYGSKYPYSDDGRIPAGGESGILEPFALMSYLAAVTNRVRIGTGICLVPQRNPVYTAKEVASIDWLSGGRFDFGVGIGWLAEEFQAVGVPWPQRAARTRSYIEVMKRLWQDPVSEYKDEFYELPPCRMYPKPVQQPHPPILFGGESDPALRRVADIGQGWYGFNLDPEEVPERLGVLEKMLAENGRSRADIEVSICPYLKGADPAKVSRYADVGVDQVILLAFAGTLDQLQSQLDDLVKNVIEPLGL